MVIHPDVTITKAYMYQEIDFKEILSRKMTCKDPCVKDESIFVL